MNTRLPEELIDIGVNLGHASFRRDRDEVIARQFGREWIVDIEDVSEFVEA